MTKLDQVLRKLPKHFPEMIGLLLMWGLTAFCVLSNYRADWSQQNFGVFSLCFLPLIFSVAREFEMKRFFGGIILSGLFVLLSFKVFKDLYFIQPFWGFYIESTLVLGSFMFALVYCVEEGGENRFEFAIQFFFSVFMLLSLQRLSEGLFKGIEKYDWDQIRVAIWTACFYVVRRINLKSVRDDLYNQVQKPTFLTVFCTVLIFAAWAFTVFKLGTSYHKIYFYFGLFAIAFWLPRKLKAFLILLLGIVNLHTGWQVIHMTYEVSYSYLFLLGCCIFLFLIFQELKAKLRMLLAPISVLILTLGFSSRLHLYHLNLISTKSLLVEVATRMEMYQEGKIVPIKKEISNEAKKRFGSVLFTLIKYHPVDSFQDIFGPDLKTIFQHSRPMYSDETYDKFRSRLHSVLSRLNINWHVQANLRSQGKNVTISSIDHNTQMTRLKSEDFVSRGLNFQFKLKDGRTLTTKAEPRTGQVQVLINDQVVKTVSFQKVVYQHIPEDFPEKNLQLHLQPDQLERVLEIQGLRIRIKVNRIFGRKEGDNFKFSQLDGQVFLKSL